MAFGAPLYWRETHKQPKLLIFDGRLIVILLLVILHVRLWTILLAVSAMLTLFFFERKGVPADSILRYLRSSFVGRRRSARGLGSERMPVDFGFETPRQVALHRAAMEARSASSSGVKSRKKKLFGLIGA